MSADRFSTIWRLSASVPTRPRPLGPAKFSVMFRFASRTGPSSFACILTRICSWRLAFLWIVKNGRPSLLLPELRAELAGESKPVLLVTAISREAVVILWPVPLPDESGRRNAWAETAREACELAKSAWVRLAADMSLGAYRIYEAEGQLSEPIWPEKTLPELLKLAFKDRIIDSADHPVIRRLRGLS